MNMKIRQLVFGVMLLAAAGLAQAATIVVTTATDTMNSDGLCSLREAMVNAENADQSGSIDCPAGSVAGNLIVFDSSLNGSVLELASQPLPEIVRPVEILGPERGNPASLTIDAVAVSRVFTVRGADEVLLSDMTLINGRTFNDTRPGSTVFINEGAVVRLERVWIESGIAQGTGNNGGAVAVFDSSLLVEESLFQFNQTSGAGGAIFASNSTIQLDDTIMNMNVAVGRGGALHAAGGQVSISDSQIQQHSNSGDSAFGGALFLDGADLVMSNTNLVSNMTTGENAHGGALYLRNASLSVSGGIIQNNTVQGVGANGGGISTFNADATLSGGCEILDNTTQQDNGWGGAMRIGNSSLDMTNCLVSGNQTFGDNAHGGGIYVIGGNAVIENSQILGNQTHGASAQGGGVRVRDGALTMTDMLVQDNATNGSSGHGGGIYHRNGETKLAQIRVSGNQTTGGNGQGAGIYLLESELTLSDAWIESNQADNGAVGAGLALFDGDFMIERTTISANQGSASGGGLVVADSQVLIVNSTIAGNQVDAGTGSGLWGNRSDIELVHVTVADNVNPPGNLSHLFVTGEEAARPSLSLYNSLIINNRCGGNEFADLSGDGNFGTHESCPGQTAPAAAIDIATLADNGGYAPTLALNSGSIAVNAAGNCLTAYGIDEDQRGFDRPGGSSSQCDVGAYETDLPPAPVDLGAELLINPAAAQVGQQLSVFVDISNHSTTWASGVEVDVDIGNAMVIQDVDYDTGDFNLANGYWVIGLVGPGETVSMELTVELTASGSREVVISLVGDQPDPVPGNDFASQVVLELGPSATLVVDTLLDNQAVDGLCSLREAILNANNADQSGSIDCVTGGFESNTIEFHPDLIGGTILLFGEQLPEINRSLVILGPEPGQSNGLVIDANQQSRHFLITQAESVRLIDLTLTNGFAGNAPGGAIFILDDSVVELQGLTLTDNATIATNGSGGAIHARDSELSIISSQISNNNTGRNGGGVYVTRSTVQISGTTIEGNSAENTGGGLYLHRSSGMLRNSTISGNSHAVGLGAGLHVTQGEVSLVQVTAANNQGSVPTIPDLFANGTEEIPALINLINSLVVSDRCGSNLYGSISASNSLGTHSGCTGTATSAAEINLGPLSDNGGPTPTHALQLPSVAINAAGDCGTDWDVTIDQRGQPRPGGSISACDVGAYEFQGEVPEADLAISMTADHEFRLVGQQVQFTMQVSQSGPGAASGVTTQIDWPSGLSFLNTTPSGADFDSATGLWTIGALNLGQTAPLTVRFLADEVGQQTVTAVVSALQQDPDASNNVASVSVDVVPEPEPIIVTTLADAVVDDGECSLREAIINANNNDQSGSVDCPSGSPLFDEIHFDPALAGGTLLLNGQPLPTITEQVTILGPIPDQADGLIIDGDDQSRLMHWSDALLISIEGVTLTGGQAPQGAGGGALLIENVGNADFRHVRFINNQAPGLEGHGGAVKAIESAVSFRDCELSGNSSGQGKGGAIFLSQENAGKLQRGPLRLRRCLLADNYAGDFGGAIFAEDALVDLEHSTLSGNESAKAAGGLFVDGGRFSLYYATLVDNQAATGPQDLAWLASQTQPSWLEASLIVQSAPGMASCSFDSGAAVNVSFSLATDASCQAALIAASAAALGPLADNGGPTRTHALETGSAAVDLVSDCGSEPMGGNRGGLTDQRGQPRPGAGSTACDAGAFERQGQTPDRIFHDRFGP
jgi:CSLREA domain-containing protein